MRARERWYFAVIGLVCCLAIETGLWLMPILALVLLEGAFTLVERRRLVAAPVTRIHAAPHGHGEQRHRAA